MKKLEFICSLPSKNNLGGETLKNKILYEYLKEQKIKFNLVDFEKYKKNKITILFKCIFSIINPFTNKILISKASFSSYYFFKLCYYLNFFNKKIYYMVIGGTFPKFLEEKTFNIKYYKNIEKIYVESLKMKEKMLSMGLKQTKYLPNFKKFEIKDRSKKNIEIPLKGVFFARITKEKGTEMIFEILQKINKEEVKIEVDFYGPIAEEYEKEFEKNISLISSAAYKGILNPEEKIYDILSKYDLMLFPTFWKGEGFPGSLLDAFISSLPVVASDWNYNKEIVNEKVGYLFESKNQKQFEKIIFDLIKNSNQLLKKRKNCFEKSKKYHVNNVLKKFLEDLK